PSISYQTTSARHDAKLRLVTDVPSRTITGIGSTCTRALQPLSRAQIACVARELSTVPPRPRWGGPPSSPPLNGMSGSATPRIPITAIGADGLQLGATLLAIVPITGPIAASTSAVRQPRRLDKTPPFEGPVA